MLAYAAYWFWFDWPLLALTAILFISFFLSIRQVELPAAIRHPFISLRLAIRARRWKRRRNRLLLERADRFHEDMAWLWDREEAFQAAMRATVVRTARAARGQRRLLDLVYGKPENERHSLKVVS